MAFSPHGLTHRPTVTGRRGMIASAHPLASVAGLRILTQGGNAIDAAVATAAALNVVEPYMSGIGGVGYMHIYSADRKEHKIVDYVGLTPQNTDLAMYSDGSAKDRGPLSPLVPGACGGWLAALERYGRMDAATVFAPAIEYAEQGFAVTVKNNQFMASSRDDLRKYPSSAAAYLLGGETPLPGQVMRQPDLGRTFRRVAEEGPELFYKGDIARSIADYMAATGGLITLDDLANFEVAWHDPAYTDYRGYRVFAPPLPCQAVQYLEILNIMEGFDVGAMGHNTAATLHRFIEADKLATADRAEYAAIDKPPTSGLLSKEYAAQRRALIGDKAQPTGGDLFTANKQENEVVAGDPYAWLKSECTTHFDTIDDQGNAVAVTQSLGSGFGSAMVVPETGVALNNFMRWFDLEPTSPNAIGPGKKNEMCVSPAQVWDDNGLRLLIGTPGSYGILQTTPQMIMNVIDHQMNVQAAIEAPRVKLSGNAGYSIDAETRIAPEVLAELEAMGHRINPLGDWSAGVGGGQGIMVDPETGSFMGGADPRRDGYALGW
ncbi:MAG: gamma-glutamyltransferase [Candidatus Latescibacteria bacterium]|nr:gamma-glutamyltransferase [Candidatus Latescibacterota bacterium]